MSEKKEVWTIESIQKVREVVKFDKPLTKEEATECYQTGFFEDILDEDFIEVLEVTEVE